MPLGPAYVLNVIGADALLGGSSTWKIRLSLSQKNWFKGQHARNRQQNRWIFRHERSTGQSFVALGLKESEKGFADLRTRQRSQHGYEYLGWSSILTNCLPSLARNPVYGYSNS
jgi:hypothetical protein